MPSYRVGNSQEQRRYKNRKKTLRQREKAGNITAANRQQLQHEAYLVSIGDLNAEPLHIEAIRLGEEYLKSLGDDHIGACKPICYGSKSPICECPICKGLNHGIARGSDSRPAYYRHGKTLAERTLGRRK